MTDRGSQLPAPTEAPRSPIKDVPGGRQRVLGRQLALFIRDKDVWLVLLFMIVVASLLSPDFLTPGNVKNLLRQSSIVGLLTIGQFLVILTGGFDLSVGAILALSSVITARFVGEGLGTALLLALGVGALLGLLNGLTTTKGKIPPFIATLGMLGIARGLAFMVSEGSVTMEHEGFRNLATAAAGPVPFPALVWIALAGLAYAFLRLSRTGLHIYAVGGREDTARLAGVEVTRVKLVVYTLSGLLAGVGGILFVGRSGSGMPHVGGGWELDSIAAVVIGGASLFGGRGSLTKAMAGVLIYMMIRNIMNLMGLDPYLQDMLKAVVIFAAVAVGVTWSREDRP